MKFRSLVLLSSLWIILIAIGLCRSQILEQYHNPALLPNCAVRPLSCTDQTKPIETMDRVLVIAAHPDDIESAAGGTIARLVNSGVEVRYILVTNGDRGTSNRSMTPAELSIIRKQEQLNAAAVLGVKSVDFLDVEDGSVRNTEALQLNMTRLIRKYRPQAIFTWNPSLTGQEDLYLHGLQHSDHRTTGLIVLDVVYPKIRDFLYFTELLDEGYEPWIVKEVFLFAWQVDVLNPTSLFQVDITTVFDAKMKALLQHKSQISDPVALTAGMKVTGSKLAAASSPAASERIYAEWFTRILFM